MLKFRFSIARLMGIVLVVAVGLGGLVRPSPTRAGAIFLMTCGILGLALVGAIYRRGKQRAWWVGFCVFGWGYLFLAMTFGRGGFNAPSLLTSQILSALRPRLGHDLPGVLGPRPPWNLTQPYYQIGHTLWTLLAGLAGGTLARIFLALPGDEAERPEPAMSAVAEPSRRRWLWPALVTWGGMVLLCSAAAILSDRDAEAWAGAAFFLTSVLIGMACLCAIFGHGRRRQAGIGAALFGAGYMLLVFARAPYQLLPSGQVRIVRSLYHPLPTTSLLNGLRRWTSSFSGGSDAANARIIAALEQPVEMTFPDPTPIQDVLKYIRLATATPTYPGIPIYLDPIGLREVEKTPASPVTINLVGVPLKTSLRLCLEQLGLAYEVREGLLRVIRPEESRLAFEGPDMIDYSSQEDESFQGLDMIVYNPLWFGPKAARMPSDLDDAFMVVGHSLLALLAAAFGAVAAPLVASPRIRSNA